MYKNKKKALGCFYVCFIKYRFNVLYHCTSSLRVNCYFRVYVEYLVAYQDSNNYHICVFAGGIFGFFETNMYDKSKKKLCTKCFNAYIIMNFWAVYHSWLRKELSLYTNLIFTNSFLAIILDAMYVYCWRLNDCIDMYKQLTTSKMPNTKSMYNT